MNLRWWLALLVAFAWPFALVIGSHDAAGAWLPGGVSLDRWRVFSSVVFLLALVPIAWLLWRSTIARPLRVVLAVAMTSVLAICSCTMQVRSTCAEASRFIGSAPPQRLVASCN